jgi:CheY-like chemotaxis protein
MNASIDILLVEDDPGDVHLALAVFRALRIEDRCVVVNDGEEALDYLHSRGLFVKRPPGMPRLILLDLKMRRMNGFELLQQIKQDDKLKVIPVVALTSSREERDVERAYDLAVNGYVVKSINFTDYRSTLQALAKYWNNVNERPPGFVHRGVAARAQGNGLEWLWSLCPMPVGNR